MSAGVVPAEENAEQESACGAGLAYSSSPACTAHTATRPQWYSAYTVSTGAFPAEEHLERVSAHWAGLADDHLYAPLERHPSR